MNTVGDRDRFALSFELRDDPDAGGPPEETATWGAVGLWVAGRNLTAGRADDGSPVDVAEVPLSPVVRWLAEQWDPLLHEERLPRPSSSNAAAAWRMDALASLPRDEHDLDQLLDDREAWWSRHGLGSALPGYRIPDLHILRSSSEVELSWDDREWRSVPRGVRLIEAPGAVELPAAEVADVLHRWARAVVDAARGRSGAEGFVADMDRALEALRHRPDHMGRLKWAAGQRLEEAADAIRDLAGVTGGPVAETIRAMLGIDAEPDPGLITAYTLPVLLYRCARPSLWSDDLLVLLRLTRTLPAGGVRIRSLQRRRRPPSFPAAITTDGYDSALALRSALGIPPEAPLMGPTDLESWLLPRLAVQVRDVRLADTRVEGAAILKPGHVPVVAVNKSGRFSSTQWGRRMTLAHELCHLLHDLDADGRVGVVSNPWAPGRMERRANAFAAMLLMPEPALEALLPRDTSQWTSARLRCAMDHLGVGRTALTWHLQNLDWISPSEREALLDEA